MDVSLTLYVAINKLNFADEVCLVFVPKLTQKWSTAYLPSNVCVSTQKIEIW